mgnify:CR=1 FL=1
MPPGGLNLRWPEGSFLQLEERLTRWKLPAAIAYARANRLDHHAFGRRDGEPARLGIVSTGKSWLDVMQALADLGLDEAAARAAGVKVWRVAMPWPLEPEGLRGFAQGCEELLVIEEKRALIESQLKEALYPLAERPRVVGKVDESGAALVPDYGEVSPASCARLIAGRLKRWAGRPDDARGALPAELLARIDAQLARLDAKERAAAKSFETIERIPYFCSGCPHNTSTRVPEGSRALAGIGCHTMAMWMGRSTATFTHMGGEGMTWVGQAPFSETRHVFQNLGDGTYFHSGSLAIRHAVATKTPITYKILFNDAVAMTGGQKHDGQLTPRMIAQQVRAEGVGKVVVVTDEPDKYPSGYFDADVAVHHRSRLDEVQRELREYPDVSVLIYDQTCAAEKRRRRKRAEFPDPPRRAFINEAVCEGCGDCGVKSNCVSIEPVETEFGRKRAINQSSCNKDFSCVEGFCPSFVTVHGGRLRRKAASPRASLPAAGELPVPDLPAIRGSYGLLVAGIGGTGVVTIGQLLGMAAHLEGKGVTVLDVTGLAQKNGAVMSFVRFAEPGEPLYAPRIGTAAADAVLGCDVVVTAGREALARMDAARTRVVANVASTPTADFTRNPDWKFPLGGMEAAIVDAVGEDRAWFVDGTRLATALLGDAIAANLFMLGFAWQRGLVPVSDAAIERAIDLNDVAIEQNKAAFAWGRVAAVDPARVEAAVEPAGTPPVARRLSTSLDEIVARRVDELAEYQDERYARRYAETVERVKAAERALVGEGRLATVAGGGGDDRVTIRNLLNNVFLNGAGQQSGDSLLIDDSTSTTPDRYALDLDNVIRKNAASGGPAVAVAGLEAVELRAGEGHNQVHVETAPFDLAVYTNGGNDSIVVNDSTGVVRIHTGGEVANAPGAPLGDSFSVGIDNDAIPAAVSIGQDDQVILFQVGAAGTLRLDNNAVLRKAPTNLFPLPLLLRGTLDLGGGALIYDEEGSPQAFRQWITAGRNGGTWDGRSPTGAITSSQAAATADADGVGYGRGTEVALSQIGSFTINPGDMGLRDTIAGDADLNGRVDIADFARLAASFNSTSVQWTSGDFDYDTVTGIGDFAQLANHFNRSIPIGSARPGAQAIASGSERLIAAI